MSAEPEKSKSDTRVVIRNIGFLPTGYHLSIPRSWKRPSQRFISKVFHWHSGTRAAKRGGILVGPSLCCVFLLLYLP